MAIDKFNADDYDSIVQADLTPNQPEILASEVFAEIEKRCGSGQQYCTFPNTISDDEKAKLEAAGYIVTRNTIDSENIDGADSRYIGFQVALNETAAEKALVIGQKGENGIGGGGGGSTLIEKSISANGVYNASDDSADGYSKVTVDVPNTYTAQDEGKVVDNGALVAQTAMSSEVTENGTVDTTLYNSVTVNVPSGGDATFKIPSFESPEFRATFFETLTIPDGFVKIGIQSLSTSVTYIYLKEIEIPESVTSIANNSFGGGKVPNLEKIIINKPQDSISGAPWGAPNTAQIIWTG